MLTGLLYYCTLLSKEFLLFSTIPIPIETVMPIRTTIAVCLIVSFAIYTLEDMRIWLTNLSSCTIYFLVFHAIPCFLSVMFGITSSIVLSTPGDIRVTTQCQMFLLPTVLTLRNSWVHVSLTNGHNKSPNVKLSIDDVLYTRTALGIPDIYPYHRFIRFG